MGPLQALEETLADPRHSKEFADFVRAGNYDFVDFGCSTGGSIQWAKRQLNGTKGLGIDIDPKKVAATREAGFDAIIYDINKIPPRKLVRFTVLSHFLEHIPNLIDVKNFIRKQASDCICPPGTPVCVCDHLATLNIITRRPIVPTDAEIETNSRARSAKLRVAERISSSYPHQA